MPKTLFVVAALAMGVTLGALSATPAQALTISKQAMTPAAQKNVEQVRYRGPGGFRGRGFRGRGFHGRGFRGPRFGHRRFYNRRFGRRYGGYRRYGYRRYGYPYLYLAPYYGYYGYGYYNRCYWLKRRAIRTGSRYWWRRYRACRYYYY
jgi:hypothetical protein